MTEPIDAADWDARRAALPEHKRALLDLLLAQRVPGRLPGNIAVLRPADAAPARPIVLIHPIGGGVFCYSRLGRALPADRPVWAVAADETLRSPTSVGALATHYLALLTSSGAIPAVLSGWSFGGLIAYEMARRWPSRPRPHVVLLDSMTWPDEVPAWDLPHTTEVFVQDLVRSAGAEITGHALSTVTFDAPVERALAEVVALLRTRDLDLPMDVPDLVERHRLFVNATRAMQRYRPGPYDGAVLLIHAADSDVRPDEWRAVVTGPLRVAAVPGDHYSILKEPGVQQVVQAWSTSWTCHPGGCETGVRP